MKSHFDWELWILSILFLSIASCDDTTTEPSTSCVEGYCQVFKYSEIQGNWILFKWEGTISFMSPKPFDSVQYVSNLNYSDIFVVDVDSAKYFARIQDTCYTLVFDVGTTGQELSGSGASYFLSADTLKIKTIGANSDGWQNVSYFYMPNRVVSDIRVCKN